MDLNDLPETIQHTVAFAGGRTGDQQTNRPTLTGQQPVLAIPEDERKSYPTDLTDSQWQRIVPLLPPAEPKGRQNGVELRKVINGILYVVCGSHDWRSFPRDLPPRRTVYSYFRQWQPDGTLQRILNALCSDECEAAGHDNIWPLDEQFEVMRYAEWLTAEAKRNNNDSHQEESRKYAEDALRTVTFKGQEFLTFGPFLHALSASKTLTRKQTVVLSLIILGCGLGLLFYGMKLVVVIIAMITLLYFSSLLLDFLLTMLALSQSTEEQIDDAIVHALADADWPQYTILCPLYRESEVVPQFVQAMQALDYPADKLQILFLTEENDEETRKAIAALHLPHHFSIVTAPDGQPRTKPRACNFGLLQATGDYVVIYDAEDIPDPLQLKKAILTFANH